MQIARIFRSEVNEKLTCDCCYLLGHHEAVCGRYSGLTAQGDGGESEPTPSHEGYRQGKGACKKSRADAVVTARRGKRGGVANTGNVGTSIVVYVPLNAGT